MSSSAVYLAFIHGYGGFTGGGPLRNPNIDNEKFSKLLLKILISYGFLDSNGGGGSFFTCLFVLFWIVSRIWDDDCGDYFSPFHWAPRCLHNRPLLKYGMK